MRARSVAACMFVRRIAAMALVLAVAATGSACEPSPVPIVYGQDVCEHCRMLISDERYGAELVARTGRVLRFDSIECLAEYVAATDETGSIHTLWVTPFHEPGTLIRIDQALLLESPTLHSPMGAGLGAFRAATFQADALVRRYGGTVVTWSTLLERVRSS